MQKSRENTRKIWESNDRNVKDIRKNFEVNCRGTHSTNIWKKGNWKKKDRGIEEKLF